MNSICHPGRGCGASGSGFSSSPTRYFLYDTVELVWHVFQIMAKLLFISIRDERPLFPRCVLELFSEKQP